MISSDLNENLAQNNIKPSWAGDMMYCSIECSRWDGSSCTFPAVQHAPVLCEPGIKLLHQTYVKSRIENLIGAIA